MAALRHHLHAAGLILAGCARTAHTPVDLQLDVDAALPAAAESVRICVTDGPSRTFPVRTGRFAVVGVDGDVPAEVIVDVLDDRDAVLGRAGPVVVDDYVAVGLEDCDGCTTCVSGGLPAPAETAIVLGVRFP